MHFTMLHAIKFQYMYLNEAIPDVAMVVMIAAVLFVCR